MMPDIDMELLLLDDSEQYWEIHLDEHLTSRGKRVTSVHKVTAHGFGYDLGQRISDNYREKYKPENYVITSKTKDWSEITDEDLCKLYDSMEELEELNEATKPSS
jgi:deoxyxylulose-5-phosphate synthase